jgi:hypothetical protein
MRTRIFRSDNIILEVSCRRWNVNTINGLILLLLLIGSALSTFIELLVIFFQLSVSSFHSIPWGQVITFFRFISIKSLLLNFQSTLRCYSLIILNWVIHWSFYFFAFLLFFVFPLLNCGVRAQSSALFIIYRMQIVIILSQLVLRHLVVPIKYFLHLSIVIISLLLRIDYLV